MKLHPSLVNVVDFLRENAAILTVSHLLNVRDELANCSLDRWTAHAYEIVANRTASPRDDVDIDIDIP